MIYYNVKLLKFYNECERRGIPKNTTRHIYRNTDANPTIKKIIEIGKILNIDLLEDPLLKKVSKVFYTEGLARGWTEETVCDYINITMKKIKAEVLEKDCKNKDLRIEQITENIISIAKYK